MNLDIEKFEIIQKVILLASGFFVLIFKLRFYFSSKNLKHDLKQDIEILEILKRQGNLETQNIETKVKADLDKIYNPNQKRESGIFGFMMGFAFFIGFGWWSFDIYNNNDAFNAWIILTLLFSLLGLSTILMDTSYTIKNEPFYKFGLFEKANLRVGIIMTLISGVSLYIFFSKIRHFSVWEILIGLFFLYGIMMIIKCIKRIK